MASPASKTGTRIMDNWNPDPDVANPNHPYRDHQPARPLRPRGIDPHRINHLGPVLPSWERDCHRVCYDQPGPGLRDFVGDVLGHRESEPRPGPRRPDAGTGNDLAIGNSNHPSLIRCANALPLATCVPTATGVLAGYRIPIGTGTTTPHYTNLPCLRKPANA